MRYLSLALVLPSCALVALLGCTEAEADPDGGRAGRDSGRVDRDGGGRDGGRRDSGVPRDAMGPAPVVGDCAGLAGDGVFEDITPPEVRAGIGMLDARNQEKGGTFAMALDPVHQGTVYAGSLFQGVWKSTDCGANWVRIATGRNAEAINTGMNWTFAVDPQEPETLYTNSGYSANGLYKSVNGGVDWDVVWPPAGQPELGDAFTYNFANVVAIDPWDHEHILLTFHEECLAPHPDTCIAETFDGGDTWTLLDGDPSWNGNEGQVIFFLENSDTWLWGSQTNGFFRSGNRGESWEEITGMTTSHLQGSQLLRTASGSFFVAGADGIWRSATGAADDWSLVPDTGPIAGGLVSDGTTMFMSTCYFGGFCDRPRYLRSPETDGNTWTEITQPILGQGGNMAFDPGHHLLYSSNLDSGLWRVVLR